MKVAIIGAGNMGGAIARGMAQGTLIPAENITVANPSSGKLHQLKAEFPAIQITNDNRTAAFGADLVILAVKPWLIRDVLCELQLPASTLITSVAAGVTIQEILTAVGHENSPVVRIMPNTAISLLQSMTLLSCSHSVTPSQKEWIFRIFQEMGATCWISEEKLPAATSLASCGIAYAFKYIQAAMQAGIEMGLYPQDAIQLAAQSMKGAAEIMLNQDTHPGVEIDKVCTPGGLTIKGINELDHHGFTSAIIQAMKASSK